jgi:hypothetical protein
VVIGGHFVFVHVPKTGGISITAALGGRATDVSLHRPLHALDLNGRKAFGFVRNPWDWRVSNYCYQRENPTPEGFREWLLRGTDYLGDDYRKRPVQPIQRRSQMYWLYGCDRIGRFENIKADFADICRELGIAAEPLPHLNKTARPHYTEFYDAETLDFMRCHGSTVIDLFGYRYGE